MKLTLPNSDHFSIREIQIAQTDCFLINPKPTFHEWSENDLKYRSCVIDKEGSPISLSLKKFFNHGERDDICKLPEDLRGVTFVEKIDGSTLLISRYKGTWVVRNRGNVDVYNHGKKAGDEVFALIKKYNLENWWFLRLDENGSSEFTLIFEYVSPANTIVIKHGVPEIYLIGIINHSNYYLLDQNFLDAAGKTYGLKRPKTFKFDNYDHAIQTIGSWVGQEGCCAYFDKDQSIIKIKSADYLKKHKLKSSLGNINNLIDIYFSDEARAFEGGLYKFIYVTFDYEIAEYCKDQILIINGIQLQMDDLIGRIKLFLQSKKWENQKELAQNLLSKYPNDYWIGFLLYKKGQLSVNDEKKLFLNLYEKSQKDQEEAAIEKKD